ncbi:MAG: hypothetical protein A3J79_07305 [Elusimicrobia bacterium RIFOXYB2_FULL_62_6]|nr:MAG: hypothetical protein A3J79_07305 [Elusimicrobia bacterium RIFOXYB2_FULL_62_6]
MSSTAEKRAQDLRAAAPAVFLLLAAALGGLRDLSGWAVFSALFAGYLLAFERNRSYSLTLPLGLLAAWLAAGLYFSPEPLNSFWHFSRYLLFMAFFAFARTRGEEAGKFWAGAVTALGCLAAAAALCERALGATPAGIIGANPNYGAAFMAAGLAGAAACLPGKSGKDRLAYGGIVLLLAAGILAANSRGAFLAAAAAVCFLLWLKKGLVPALSLAGALVLAAALLPAEQLGWFLKLRDPRSLERIGIWTSALGGITAQPVFGSGLGLFERVFELFKFPFYNGISYYGHSTLHAHSELLNLAAEAGLPAAALLAWAWVAGVLRGKGAGAGPRDAALKAFAVALFAQAAVDIVFYSGAVQLCFFGTLGLLAPRAPAEEGAGNRRGRAWLYLFAAALAAGLLLKRGFERDSACASAPGAAGEACLKKALRFSPGDAGLRKSALAAALASGNFTRAAALADDLAFIYPKDPFLAEAAAEARYGGGDAAGARAGLIRALELEPDFLSARLGLAQLLAREKNGKAADAEFAKLDKAAQERRPRPKTAYDSALLYLPQAAHDEMKKWKKRSTGGTTVSTRKPR